MFELMVFDECFRNFARFSKMNVYCLLEVNVPAEALVQFPSPVLKRHRTFLYANNLSLLGFDGRESSL